MFASLVTRIREINLRPEGFLPLHAPVFAGNEERYVLDTLRSTFVSSVGEYVNRLEEMLRDITGATAAVACVNGTAALEMALRLAGVLAGDVVITQSLTFVATANAIRHAQAEPVFLDVDPARLGLSPAAVRAFLEESCTMQEGRCRLRDTGQRVAACVPMHCFGLPCDTQALLDICAEWGIPLVEDAAESLGSTMDGRHCGTFGRVASLSFNGNKIVTTGGGGAILTDDEDLGRLAKHLTTTAKRPHRWAFEHDAVAWNYRLPNINAALGCAQLERLEEFVAIKRSRADAYAALFADTDWSFVREPAGCRSNYWLCAVLAPGMRERDAFLEAANDAGVMTRPAWNPMHTLPMYRDCRRDALAATMDIAERLVNLPSGV